MIILYSILSFIINSIGSWWMQVKWSGAREEAQQNTPHYYKKNYHLSCLPATWADNCSHISPHHHHQQHIGNWNSYTYWNCLLKVYASVQLSHIQCLIHYSNLFTFIICWQLFISYFYTITTVLLTIISLIVHVEKNSSSFAFCC